MLFLKEKQVKALIVLKNKSLHLSKIAKEIDSTYLYITKLMNILEKKGLVIIKKKGHLKIVELTDNGKKLAENLESVLNLL